MERNKLFSQIEQKVKNINFDFQKVVKSHK